MKIVMIDTSPIRRGAQVFVQDLTGQLEDRGHETKRIYLFQNEPGVSVHLREQDIVLPFQESTFLEKIPSFQPKLLRKLGDAINEFGPEIILFNGSKTLKYAAWLRIFGLVKKGRFVGRFIDDAKIWNPAGLKRWVYTQWINHLDAVVAVSQSSLDSMIQHYRFRKPVRVIHRAFDTEKFADAPGRDEARRSLGLGKDDEVLLFLGNLTAQKRPDRFVEIVKRLAQSRPNLKALIVGDGILRKELEARVLDSETSVFRLRLSVFFRGYQTDVAPFLSVADLLILTSDTEGLPGVVLEGAYFAVPAVATEVGGIRECLIDGETGVLVPDRSIGGFCERISHLLDHPDVRQAMGQGAKKFVADHFQMDRTAMQYLDFFRELLSSSSQSPRR